MPSKGVNNALAYMRKSHTGRTRVERENDRTANACDELINQAKRDAAKRKEKRLRKRAKRLGLKYPPKKIDDDKEPPEYIKKILSDAPLKLRSLSQLRTDGAASYALSQSANTFDQQAGRIGIPRKIFTELIDEVKKEQAELKDQRRLKIKEKRLRAQDTSDLPFTENIMGESMDRIDIRRPQTAGAVQQVASSMHDFHFHENDDDEDIMIDDDYVDSSPSPSHSRPQSPSTLRHNNNIQENDNIEVKRKRKKKGKAVSKHSQRINDAYERKQALLKAKEDALLAKIAERTDKHKRQEEEKLRRNQQCIWLVLVTHLARVHRFQREYFDQLKPARDAKVKSNIASAQKVSVAHIENWWYYMRLDLRLKRNAFVNLRMGLIFRFFLAKLHIKKRRAGAEMIKKFCKDTANNGKVRRLYSYRSKIIRLQRWFRSWLDIQETRMSTMWLALDKVGRKRIADSLRAARAKESRAIKAMSESAGFGDTLNRIDRQKAILLDIFTGKEREREMREMLAQKKARKDAEAAAAIRLKERLAREKIEAEEAAQREKKQEGRVEAHFLSKANAEASFNLMAKGVKDLAEKKKATPKKKSFVTPGMVKALQKHNSWYWKSLRSKDPVMRQKFVMLRDMMADYRKEYILKMDDVTNLGKGNKNKVPKVNLDALKHFMLLTKDDEEEVELFEKDEDGTDPMERMRNHSHDHPPFTMWMKAMEYFNHVHLSFYDDVLANAYTE